MRQPLQFVYRNRLQFVKKAIDEGAAVSVSAAEGLQELYVIGLYLVCVLVCSIRSRTLLAVLYDNDLSTVLYVFLSDLMVRYVALKHRISLCEVDLVA